MLNIKQNLSNCCKMEYTLPELLTREGILHILQKRQLKMPDIESLPHKELLRIYKAFAVPLAQREIKSAKHKKTNPLKVVPRTLKRHSEIFPMDVDTMPCSIMETFSLSADVNNTTPMQELPLALCEKDALKEQDFAETYYLSAATKRIKISWS